MNIISGGVEEPASPPSFPSSTTAWARGHADPGQDHPQVLRWFRCRSGDRAGRLLLPGRSPEPRSTDDMYLLEAGADLGHSAPHRQNTNADAVKRPPTNLRAWSQARLLGRRRVDGVRWSRLPRSGGVHVPAAERRRQIRTCCSSRPMPRTQGEASEDLSICTRGRDADADGKQFELRRARQELRRRSRSSGDAQECLRAGKPTRGEVPARGLRAGAGRQAGAGARVAR